MNEALEAIRVLGFWRTLWYATLFRPTMRWMHRHHLHYAPPVGPLHGQYDQLQQHWCQWCGLRGDLVDIERAKDGIMRAATSADEERVKP